MKVAAALFLAATAAVQAVSAASVYVYGSNVNVRSAAGSCATHPSTKCASLTQITKKTVTAKCQRTGDTVTVKGVGSNNWWTQVTANGKTGWVTNLYIRGGHKIAGVPDCTSSSTPAKPKPTTAPANNNSPCNVPKTRQGIVDAAMWAHNTGKTIYYTQDVTPRWEGIRNKLCPHKSLPKHADCSSFTTWIYWSAFGKGTDKLSGEKWKGGNTASLKNHGKRVSLAEAKIGDLVFYENPAHVTILVQKNPAKVISYGRTGTVHLLAIDPHTKVHGTHSQIRTYPVF
ncbi:hypothetical protein HDV00_011623 [Rhizophlyctis rosea]|nr:hypothetical protein HDV00_011623 [Rhizophlyctis rosea]